MRDVGGSALHRRPPFKRLHSAESRAKQQGKVLGRNCLV
jgi:hypothetical protein